MLNDDAQEHNGGSASINQSLPCPGDRYSHTAHRFDNWLTDLHCCNLADYNVLLPHEDSEDEPQIGQLKLVVNAAIGISDGKKWIQIKLLTNSSDSSEVNPSKTGHIMFGNNGDDSPGENGSEDKHGYYTESVTVSMSALSGTGIELRDHQPQTDVESASHSTTSGFSVGIFGTDPTASFSASQSSTVELRGFTAIDTSVDATLKSTYRLSEVSGSPYKDVDDLPGSALLGYRLQDLPQMAKSNLPIPSQGKWAVDSSFTDEVTFQIEVKPTLVFANKQAYGLTMDSLSVSFTRFFNLSVDFNKF